jgi:hypothetical protein
VAGIFSALPLLILLFLTSGVQPMINDLILFPANVFPKYRWTPYPNYFSIHTIPFFVFPAVLVIGFVASLARLVKRKACDNVTCGLLFFSVLGFFFFNQVRVRSDGIHLLPVALTSILLAPILLSVLWKDLSLKPLYAKAVCAIFFAAFALIFTPPIYQKIMTFPNGCIMTSVTPDIPRAGYSILSPDLRNVVGYIRKNTSENEPIYVGVKNHDRFIINDVAVYFLADRNYATTYHELVPGLTNTLSIQKEIVDGLKDARVRIIILAQRYWYEPNNSRIDSKIDVIDDYIFSNYELKETYGVYEVWMRK